MNARTSGGFALAAGLHLVVVLALWFAYRSTQDEPPSVVASALTMVASARANWESPSSTAEARHDAAPTAANSLRSNLSRAMQAGRDTKAAQLEADARRQQALEALAHTAPPSSAPRPNPRGTTASAAAASRPARGAESPVTRIDVDSLVRELREGASGNVDQSAGPAGDATAAAVAHSYLELVEGRIKTALDERPGVGTGLVVEVEFHITPEGSIRGVRITRRSGSTAFDDAVREAIAGLRLPARPAGVPEMQRVPIRGVE